MIRKLSVSQSSKLRALFYCDETNTLYAQFPQNVVYIYEEIPEAIPKELEENSHDPLYSVGKAFITLVELPKFKYSRMNNEDSDKFLLDNGARVDRTLNIG